MGCPQTRRKISKSILRRFNTAKQPTEPAGTVRVNPFKADKDTTLRPATQVKPQASAGMNAVVGKNVFIGAYVRFTPDNGHEITDVRFFAFYVCFAPIADIIRVGVFVRF